MGLIRMIWYVGVSGVTLALLVPSANTSTHADGSDFCRYNKLTATNSKNKTHESEPRHCPIHDDNLLWFILSLFLIIAWGAFVRTILRITKLSIPYTVILMITGLILGTGTHMMQICDFWSKFTKIARLPPKIILYTFLPVLIFESAYSMDVHVFMRSLSQILVIALPGMLLSVFLTGFVCYGFMTSYHWDYPTSFMYGAIISATDPVAVVAILKELGTSKRLSTLIEGESLMNDGVAVLMFEIFKMILVPDEVDENEGKKSKEHRHIMLDILITLVKIGIGGPVFGFVTGKLCAMSLARIFNDAATEITIMLFSSYLVYWAAEAMGISGVLSVVVMALKLSEQETSISPEVKKNVHHFWEMVGYLANTVLFVLVGIILSETAIGQIDSLDWFNLFFLYANLGVLRLAILMILMPWLTRIGYGLKWQDMMVCMWGGLRGAVGLCLALEVFYSQHFCKTAGDQIGPKFLFHTGGIVFLTLFINGTTTKSVLVALHLTEVSPGRLQDMNNAIKQILATKDRAILQFRHKPALTDASWSYVKRYTRIHDPYKQQRDKEKLARGKKPSKKSDSTFDSEGGSMLTLGSSSHGGSMIYSEDEHHYHRHTAIAFPESTQDTIEMERRDELQNSKDSTSLRIQRAKEVLEAEESRQRVIKALKVSFWRQFEKGVISDVAVQILLGVADRAGDQELHIMQAKNFKKYYELHGFFHWFQKNVIERFGLDAPLTIPKKPKKEWRHLWWWIATREWFGGMMTVIVILSLIPAIWEFVREVNGANDPNTTRESDSVRNAYTLAFLLSNIIVTTIYVLEFLIKIVGLGVRGYFKDKWNWVDLVILLVGIVTLVHVEDFNTNGIALAARATRAFRVVKIIRTLRLLKCCVHRGKGFMNNRINYSIFLGYDIGTGFVKGVDDVLKFLPQMVEDEKILGILDHALQTERLETIRLLGLLQQKHTTIAIAVKTRHASRAVLNEMRETVDTLRDDGLLDQTETDVLMNLIEAKMKGLWSTPVTVTPNTPEAMLKNILWLHATDDVELGQLIKEGAVLLNFDEGDLIYGVGDEPNGIHLIVNGMVKVHFMPTTEIVQAQITKGQLPNVEALGTMSFSYEETDYLPVGYLLGEIGLVTGLPSASTITCATPVSLYHIPRETMEKALKIFASMEDSLESRIWRAVGMRIAAALLPVESEYQSWTVDRIQVHVEHSAVPIGVQYENMTIPEYITDIVLLQGEIQDGNSKEIFIAPRLLPRSCKKLSKVPDSTIPTRFLVIAEDKLEEVDSDEDSDPEDSNKKSVQQTIHKSVHQLVVRASGVDLRKSSIDITGKPSARQRNLLRKIQYEWH